MLTVKLSPMDWEERLHDSCMNGEDQKLVIDLVRLLKMGKSEKNPIQFMVLRKFGVEAAES